MSHVKCSKLSISADTAVATFRVNWIWYTELQLQKSKDMNLLPYTFKILYYMLAEMLSHNILIRCALVDHKLHVPYSKISSALACAQRICTYTLW
jgi:hypothetical protein